MNASAASLDIVVPGTAAAVLSEFEMPRVAWLAPNLAAACFGLMKLRPAREMIDSAERAGVLRRGMRVIESTSGTFGVALAMVCSRKPYQLVIVTDDATDERLRRRMEQMGARVEIVTSGGGSFGIQGARLDRLHELLAEDPPAYWLNQYDNPLNPQSYAVVADYLLNRLGGFDVLVGPVGTGGSMVGMARRLREVGLPIQAVAVDTCNSVLFGQDDGPRLIRGLGNSLLPRNLDHQAFDYVSWVPGAAALAACRDLHRQYGLFLGPTSGAAFLVARWWAASHPASRVVMICPDEGHRYVDTVYCDNWYAKAVSGHDAAADPVVVARPNERQGSWTLFHWARRTWDEVTGRSAEALHA